MSETTQITAHVCGPSTGKCKCNCPESCDHVWSGPAIEWGEGGYTATCIRCGMPAISHDLWVLP